jgi:hypothetical protein
MKGFGTGERHTWRHWLWELRSSRAHNVDNRAVDMVVVVYGIDFKDLVELSLIRDLFWISGFCLHCLFGREWPITDGLMVSKSDQIFIIYGVQVRESKVFVQLRLTLYNTISDKMGSRVPTIEKVQTSPANRQNLTSQASFHTDFSSNNIG